MLRQLLELDGDLRDVLRVGVADHRHEQTAIGVDRDADVDVLLVDDLAALGVDRRIELRELADRRRQHLTSIAVTVRLPPAFATCSLNCFRSSSSSRDVRLVELRDVRDGRSTRS